MRSAVTISMLTFLITVSVAVHAQAEICGPLKVHSYGNFKKIMATKELGGTVKLEQALSAPHIYAVGEIENAEGEITVYDGKILLNYGEDGMERSISKIPPGEEAMQLVTAQIENWQEIVIPKDMADTELNMFVLEQAWKSGIKINTPFPFLVEGSVRDLVWHVRSGAEVDSSGQGKKLFLTKRVEYRDEADVTLVGFSSEVPSGYARPGEPWHVHVLFAKENTTGHADAFSVVKESRLLLPIP